MAKTREPLVVWGASGHAAVVADIVRLQGRYEIVEFLDDGAANEKNRALCGAKVVGGRERLPQLRASGASAILIAVGDPRSRLELGEIAVAQGFELTTAIHPSAVLASDCRIGPGTVIVAGAVINPGVTLGALVVVNTSASIDHGCRIADGATICPGVHIAGDVRVGRAAWIGIGASVCQRVEIGDEAVIGAGAVVLRDIPPSSVAYGVPARVVRSIDDLNRPFYT
ncbi:MAG TPA: acetyltransferase [Pirellulales bacterium]|nr:acetyltransferase [Pirellulales bacterium]